MIFVLVLLEMFTNSTSYKKTDTCNSIIIILLFLLIIFIVES